MDPGISFVELEKLTYETENNLAKRIEELEGIVATKSIEFVDSRRKEVDDRLDYHDKVLNELLSGNWLAKQNIENCSCNKSMTFEGALKAMKDGKVVQRSSVRLPLRIKCGGFQTYVSGWGGYDLMFTKNILADDWEIVEDPEHEN